MLRKDPSHAKSPRKPHARRRREGGSETGYERLEERKLLAVAKISLKAGLLAIIGNDSSTQLHLSSSGSKLVVTDQISGKTWKYTQSKISAISFQGGAANDQFFSLASNIPVTARGGGGNDQLRGGSGQDQLFGDDGADTLHGFAGIDYLFGGNGDDVLVAGTGDDHVWGHNGNDLIFGGGGHDRLSGEAGNDRIFGDDGNDILWGGDGMDTLLGNLGDDQLVGGTGGDHLNGQLGADRLWGEEGDDTLIGIDGLIADYLEGGTGKDVIWRDDVGLNFDLTIGQEPGEITHSIWRFNNDADLTLDGDRVADPVLHGSFVYKNFNGPLFSNGGPALTDTLQGNLADCYLIAGLGAIAYDRPDVLKSNMVDFNDGTFGVHMGGQYFRVDGDLPVVTATSTTPAFAKLGAEGSLWVALAEKAFAHHRSSNQSYQSIGYGWQWEVYQAFNALEIGSDSFTKYGSAAQLASQLHLHWNLYRSTTVGLTGLMTNTYGLVMNHAYVVHSFNWSTAGTITSVTFRNPWGTDGSNRDSNPYDGLVTLTIDELFAVRGNGWINFARFA